MHVLGRAVASGAAVGGGRARPAPCPSAARAVWSGMDEAAAGRGPHRQERRPATLSRWPSDSAREPFVWAPVRGDAAGALRSAAPRPLVFDRCVDRNAAQDDKGGEVMPLRV